MAPSYFTRKLKRKRIVLEEKHEFFVSVSVLHAEDIDGTTTNPTGDKRIYRVFGSVSPGEEFCTPEEEGLPNPVWRRKYIVPLGRNMHSRYLKLEVVRTKSKSDPGTSTGTALVGRTRIPLPKEVDIQKTGRFGLVRPGQSGCIPEGHIVVAMTIKRI